MKALRKILLAVVVTGMISNVPGQTVWTIEKTVSSSSSGNPYGVFKIGNRFIGFGSTNAGGYAIDTSSDGINWGFCSASPVYLTSVSKVGSYYIATGGQGYIAISPDGGSWTFKSFGGSYSPVNLTGVASSGSLLVAACKDSSNGKILTSTNGTVWNLLPYLSVPALNAVIWTGAKFIAVGEKGIYMTSLDGSTWTSGTVPLSPSLTTVTWTGAYIVANGKDGGSYVSSDGTTWTIAATPVPTTSFSYTRQLIWSGKALVRTVEPNTIETSTDGIYWNMQTLNQVTTLSAIVFTGTRFLAYGSNNSSYLVLSSPLDSTITSPLSKKQMNNVAETMYHSGLNDLVQYSLSEPAQVRLRFLDLLGREVFSGINRVQGPGNYTYQIPSGILATGRYAEVFEAGQFVRKNLITLER